MSKTGYEKGGNGGVPGLLLNSDLTCKDCVLVYTPDENVGTCARFSIKPATVLEGGECDAKVNE